MATNPISDNGIQGLSPEFQRVYQMAAQSEKKPIQALNTRKELVNNKMKLLDDILKKVEEARGLMPQFLTPYAFRELSLQSSDPTALTGTVDKRFAETGRHTIDVNSLATGTTAISNGFASQSDTVGEGYFTFHTAQGDTKEVFIDSEHSTLDGLAKLINQSEMGVRATVVNDVTDPDKPFRLLLRSSEEGAAKDVNFPEFYLVDGDQELEMERQLPAQNARLKYAGAAIETASNEIKGLISGVTLNLKGTTTAGRPGTITIENDVPKISKKVKDLVDKINGILSFIQTQNTMDEHTPPDKTLGGDYGMRLTENRIRNILQQYLPMDSPNQIRMLADMGIQFNKKGTLDLDEKKLEHAINAQFDAVSHFLVGDVENPGLVAKLSQALTGIARANDGLLYSERRSFQQQERKIEKDIQTQEDFAEKRIAGIKEKLVRAEQAMSALQGQSSALANLGGGGGGGIASLPQQLLG